jgi:uncharacterized protein YodC (DUF2158 family)
MASFAPGDKVRLKAGGPEMVVDFPDEFGGGLVCSFWNTKKNQKEQTTCTPESLEKVGPAMGTDAQTLLKRVEALEARVKKLEDAK